MSRKALQALHDVAGAVSAALASRANAQHRLHELRTVDSVNGNDLNQAERDVDETLEHVLSSAKQLAFLASRFRSSHCYAVIDEEIQAQDEMDWQEHLANPDNHEPDDSGSEEDLDYDERYRTEEARYEQTGSYDPPEMEEAEPEPTIEEIEDTHAAEKSDEQKHVESIYASVTNDYWAKSNMYILQLLEFKRIPGTHKLPEAVDNPDFPSDECAMWMSNSLTGWEVCMYNDSGEYPEVMRYHNMFEVNELKTGRKIAFANCSTFFVWLRGLGSLNRPWWSKLYTDFQWVQQSNDEFGDYIHSNFTTKVWYVGEKWTACINNEQLQPHVSRVKLEQYSKEGLLIQVKQAKLSSFVKHAKAVTSDE